MSKDTSKTKKSAAQIKIMGKMEDNNVLNAELKKKKKKFCFFFKIYLIFFTYILNKLYNLSKNRFAFSAFLLSNI